MSNSGGSTPSGNSGGWWRRMSRSEQIMAAIAGALVAGIFGVIVAVISRSPGPPLNPQGGRSISAVSSPPVTTSNPTPTSSPDTAPTTSPDTAPTTSRPKVMLQDNFCSNVNGWDNVEYSGCAIRISTKPNKPSGDIESTEPEGSSVYPQAPSSIIIEVTARMIAGAGQGDLQFGIACRASTDPNGYGYAFMVEQNLVKIFKYSNQSGQVGPPLRQAATTVNLTHSNLLVAACNSLSGGAGVQLDLWVDGRHLLDVTDSSPVANGTVGLFASTTDNTPTADVVEFKSFKLIQQ